ncbi:MAG: nitroreductase family protein [Betaproteobacteria bacterium]|nr:MAG: nitroreductase family protein [Betaproteobacteria bacterium]
MHMTTVEKALQERFSCRQFLPKPVPRETIEAILRAAQMTPSWCNTQPWQITLLSGAEADRLRETLRTHAKSGAPANPDFPFPPRYEGIYRDRRKVCGVQLYQSLGIGKEDRVAAAEQALENFNFFDAPHVMLITTPENLGVYGAIDCGLYVSSFILVARQHGIDSIAQAALASYPDLLREYFQLPGDRKFVCGLSFGYADNDHPINGYRTERADISEVVDWRG